MKIKDFIDYEQPNKYIVESERYSSEYNIPVLTAGQSFILGYTNETIGIYEKYPCIIFDDFTTSVHYVDFSFKVKSSAMKILKNKENSDLKYCYYLLLNMSKMPPNHKRQWISTTSEKEHKLPSINDQRKITNILDKISNIINFYNLELKKLDELIKARFVEMFGDPIKNDKGWKQVKLMDLGLLARGISKHRPRNAVELLGGPYPLVQTGEVANADTYITSYLSTYSELGLKQSKMWPKGTLCITIAANIAQTSILTFDACFPDSVVGFIAGERVETVFVHYWFSFLQSSLEALATQVAQKNLNLKTLSNVEVIVPPIQLQSEFVNFTKQVDKSKFEVQKSLEKTQQLYDSLMQKYFG